MKTILEECLDFLAVIFKDMSVFYQVIKETLQRFHSR
jgi:hypothetical protein